MINSKLRKYDRDTNIRRRQVLDEKESNRQNESTNTLSTIMDLNNEMTPRMDSDYIDKKTPSKLNKRGMATHSVRQSQDVKKSHTETEAALR